MRPKRGGAGAGFLSDWDRECEWLAASARGANLLNRLKPTKLPLRPTGAPCAHLVIHHEAALEVQVTLWVRVNELTLCRSGFRSHVVEHLKERGRDVLHGDLLLEERKR